MIGSADFTSLSSSSLHHMHTPSLHKARLYTSRRHDFYTWALLVEPKWHNLVIVAVGWILVMCYRSSQ